MDIVITLSEEECRVLYGVLSKSLMWDKFNLTNDYDAAGRINKQLWKAITSRGTTGGEEGIGSKHNGKI